MEEYIKNSLFQKMNDPWAPNKHIFQNKEHNLFWYFDFDEDGSSYLSWTINAKLAEQNEDNSSICNRVHNFEDIKKIISFLENDPNWKRIPSLKTDFQFK